VAGIEKFEAVNEAVVDQSGEDARRSDWRAAVNIDNFPGLPPRNSNQSWRTVRITPAPRRWKPETASVRSCNGSCGRGLGVGEGT
jgi:hypothetical protein